MLSSDYLLAEKRGPMGWDYLVEIQKLAYVGEHPKWGGFLPPRITYVAHCVERAIHGEGGAE